MGLSEYREQERLRKARWRAANPDRAERKRNRKGRPQKRRPFVGVDGEGMDYLGRHVYNMMRAGEQFLAPTDGRRFLDTWQCLDFLATLDPKPIYVAYFFDYDVTKILEGIGASKLKRLMDRESRMGKSNYNHPFPVDLADGVYQIDYLPGKFFKVRKRTHADIGEDGKVRNFYGHWIEINDCGSFFQCRFPVALERWKIGTADQRAAIEKGKALRNSHTHADFERVKQYNHLEIVLLQELMERFRDACSQVGYFPRKWQGPGQIAETMLSVHGLPKTKDLAFLRNPDYEELVEFGRKAFYGGRPERVSVGPVKGPVYQWDINSAYPYALLHVPCLLHGKWRRRSGAVRSIPDLSICYGEFSSAVEGPHARPFLYGLPFRTEKGVIMYPEQGRGWYWGFEINASIHQKFRTITLWEYVPACQCKPFRFIEDVYQQRLDLGKDGAGIVLKLALNSLYGKMAQSIGSPKFANPIWASFITAFCRTQIQSLLHMTCSWDTPCGRSAIMIATDALFTTEDLNIQESKELGGWSKEVHPNGIFVVQPGFYFGSSGKPAKTRGVPLAILADKETELRAGYERMRRTYSISDGDVSVPITCFVGIRQALHRHNMGILGQWIDTTRTISFDWTTKRTNQLVIPNFPFSDHLTTLPYKEPPHPETIPYSKDIGALFEAERIDYIDQPDWSDEAYAESEEL